MTRFLKENGPLIGALGAGIAIGAGSTIVICKLRRNDKKDISEISSKIETLCKDVSELKQSVENLTVKGIVKKRAGGYYSVHASSGDEDDEEYEEAFDDSIEQLRRAPREVDTLNTIPSTPKDNTVINGIPTTDPTTFLKRTDKLLEGNDHDREEAYRLLKDNLRTNATDPELLWRMAKASTFVAQIKGSSNDMKAKKEYTYAALDYAKTALDHTNNNPNVHKWFAITMGNIGDFEGTAEKIKNGYLFKEHIQKAIQLNPKDPSSHYLLGRWSYGVYMLTWLEKKAAATLYAKPPTSTVDEALEHFMEAERLSPGNWKDNLLYIAKCHLEKRDYYKAVEWLDKAHTVPIIGQDDRTAQAEIDSLLYKYSKYRL